MSDSAQTSISLPLYFIDSNIILFTLGRAVSIMEVFMDNFSIFGSSFESCLTNLEKMLHRCKEANLILNWKMFHFMVNEGVVLEHVVSERGIEVDRAKLKMIERLLPPKDVKRVRSFLGHAGFYSRFICKFSEIARPLTNLRAKDAPFVFDDALRSAFNRIKEALMSAPSYNYQTGIYRSR